jgi:hypothetical protein
MRSSLSSTVRRLALVLAPLVVACALIVPASASARGITVRATSHAFTLRVHFPNRTPIAHRKWWITWTATKNGRRLSGKSEYQFYFGNTLEDGTQKGVRFSHGHGRDWLRFPGAAVGHPLKMRVMIVTRYGTASAWLNIKVKA